MLNTAITLLFKRSFAVSFMVWLGFVIMLFNFSCESKVQIAEPNILPPTEATKSLEPAKTAVTTNNSGAESNQNLSQNEPSNTQISNGIKLKCKEAREKRDQLLCSILLPADLREDTVFTDSFEITYCEIDLNGDDKNEIIAWESSWAGSSGGGLWVLSQSGKGYRKIFETEMTWTPIILLPSTSHQWKDFAYLVTGGGVDPVFITVSHNGKSYEDGKQTSVKQPDGQVLIERNWNSSVFGPISNH